MADRERDPRAGMGASAMAGRWSIAGAPRGSQDDARRAYWPDASDRDDEGRAPSRGSRFGPYAWAGGGADTLGRGEHRGRGPRGYIRSDERIREDVCERLSEDPLVDASDVEVTVAAGEVMLEGTVATRDERHRAEDCVHDVSGVHHVQNNLRVRHRPM